LVLCLLVCLSCATPFPFDKLEEGLTVETLLTELGPPEAIETGSGDAGSCWCYHHEEQEWVPTFFPLTPFLIPLFVVFGDSWDDAYVIRKPIVLHFEEEKLVRWDVRQRGGGYWRVRPHYRWNPHTAFDHYEDPFSSPEDHRKDDSSGLAVPGDPLYNVFDAGEYVAGKESNCESELAHKEQRIKAGDTCHVARNVTLWLDPTASSKRRESLDRGQRMTILGRRCQWCHVEDDLGRKGWVACVFLDPGEPP
jgi:hypothetical protein